MKWAGGRFLLAGVVAAWTVLASGYVQSVHANDEGTWSAVTDLRPNPAAEPQVVLADDGSMIAGWLSQGAGLTSGVSVAKRSESGTWPTPEFLQGSLTLVSRFQLASAQSSQRSAAIFTTMEYPQVWVSVSDENARNWSTPLLLNEELSYGSGDITAGPYLAMSADGVDMAAAWSYADDSGSAIVYSASDDAGVTWTAPIELASGSMAASVESPSIDINPMGTVIVGWIAAIESDPVMRARLRASTTSGAWTSADTVVASDGVSRPSWGRLEFSADGTRAVALFTTNTRDIGIRVGSVNDRTVTWAAPVSATGGIEDLSFAEPELDIAADAAFDLGALHMSQNARRMVLTFEVMPGGRGSASRAGVVVSTDAGATWNQPRWFTTGRSLVHNVFSSASADAQIVDVVFNVEVFDPVTCEEGQEECVPGNGPPNGASDVEEGQWAMSTTDGGSTWSAAELLSALQQQGATSFTSPSGTAGAIMWTYGYSSTAWVSRGVIAGLASPPSQPRGVTVTRKLQALQATWQVPTTSGSSAVTRYRATASPGGRYCEALAPVRTCTITQLVAGRGYTVSVRARNATHDGWSAAAESSTTVVAGAPSQVRTIQVARTSRGAVRLTWVAPASSGDIQLTGYRISYRVSGDSGQTVKRDLSASQRALTISGLSVGRTYTFTVIALNELASGPAASSKPYKAS